MYFGAGISKLGHASKSLQQAWDATQDGWRDQVRNDVEKRHVGPALDHTAKTLRAMDQLADLFARIYRDLS
jgi:hypothetical protein